MEKTNELNKFLPYIHMGNSVYRIYYEEAKKINNESLTKEIVHIQEIFKKHEESITKLINELGEEATNSLTAAGLMGLYKEKMKVFENSFDICISAIKTTNMGMISAIKFLEDNNKLPEKVISHIKEVINDYLDILSVLKNYILDNLI